jgi:acetamidase/formamidase
MSDSSTDVLALSAAASAALAVPSTRSPWDLPATGTTCRWGAIDPAAPSVLRVASGDVLRIEAVSHHAGDAPDLMFDDGIRALWSAIAPAERGPGVHVLTGPVAIEGAVAGGAIAVQILEMTPRLRHGSNCAAHWGLLYDRFAKERITIYELDDNAPGQGDGFPALARPTFGYDFRGRALYDVPGFVTDPADRVEEPFSRSVAVPVRPHFGVMGVAPGEPGVRSSIPPGTFGGNVDNWRWGPGATVFFPVFQDGAGLFFGDPHFAQGDGEICGTAIEASANAVVRVAAVDDLTITSPVLDTGSHWYTHGFGATLDEAMRMAAEQMLALLCDRAGLTLDDAYSLASVAVDLGVTQVVDGVVGCHASVATSIFV